MSAIKKDNGSVCAELDWWMEQLESHDVLVLDSEKDEICPVPEYVEGRSDENGV